MKIMRKAKAISDLVRSPGGAAIAEQLQGQAVAAIHGGRGSAAWETYMKNFCSNADQLQRLNGNDQMFNRPWGPLVLAYIPGDGTCGGGTNLAVGRNMVDGMKDLLDSPSLSSVTDSNNTSPLDPLLQPFI